MIQQGQDDLRRMESEKDLLYSEYEKLKKN